MHCPDSANEEGVCISHTSVWYTGRGGAKRLPCPLKSDITLWPMIMSHDTASSFGLTSPVRRMPDLQQTWWFHSIHFCRIWCIQAQNETVVERIVVQSSVRSQTLEFTCLSSCSLVEGVHCWISTMALVSLVAIVPLSQFVFTVGVTVLTGKGNRWTPVPGGIGTSQ